MSSEPEIYDDESLNAQAILLAVETGVPPDAWIDQGVIGMNTAMMYLRNKLKREAAYFGHKIRDGSSPMGDDGRQMSG